MTIEHEIKLLGIDVDKIHTFLAEHKINRDALLSYKRLVFDTVPADEGAWIRLRSDGDTTTLTYKKSHADAIDGMQEIEVVTDDFELTKDLLTAAGLTARNYQENKREVYYAFDCMITVDYWPLIPPYVEIEGKSKEHVELCLSKFKGLYKETTSSSSEAVYQSYGIDLRSIDSLSFENT